MKIKLSGAKNQKHLRSERTKRSLDKSTLYGLNRKRRDNNFKGKGRKDIELQQWMSEMNNVIKSDADQNNKMRTYRKFKTLIENHKCEDYLRQITNTRHRISLTKLKQPQTRHRDGLILKTL